MSSNKNPKMSTQFCFAPYAQGCLAETRLDRDNLVWFRNRSISINNINIHYTNVTHNKMQIVYILLSNVASE